MSNETNEQMYAANYAEKPQEDLAAYDHSDLAETNETGDNTMDGDTIPEKNHIEVIGVTEEDTRG